MAKKQSKSDKSKAKSTTTAKKPAKKAAAKKAKKRVVEEEVEEDEEGFDDEEYEDEEYEDDDEDFGAGSALADTREQEDPYWFAPHLVLGGLLLIGLFGFFGFFNNTPLRHLAAKPGGGDGDGETSAALASAAPVTPPTPAPQPATPQKPQAAQGETFGAKHMLIMYKGSKRAPAGVDRSKEEAKKRANEAAKKAAALTKGGAKFNDVSTKFSELVKKYSDEPGADRRGGDLGRFRRGSMVPQFQQAVEKLKKGQISGVVETPFGFHVIFRTL
jgi:hypothetical protein